MPWAGKHAPRPRFASDAGEQGEREDEDEDSEEPERTVARR